MTNTSDHFFPPAAAGLPAGTLEAAEIGANRLDAWARTPHGRNFLAHALVQLARTGWLRTEPGDGFEPMRDPEPTAPAVVEPPADRRALRDRIAEALLDHLSRTADIRPGRDGEQAFMPEVTDAERMRMADAVLAVLPEPADRATVLTDVERAIRSATANCGYRADDGCDFCNGVAAALVQVRRMADETATETPHTCKPGASTYHCPTSGQTESDCHGGFTTCCDRPDLHQPAAGARQDGTQTTALNVLRCLASPEACRWEGVYCVTHSWKSDVGRCPHGQAQALLGGGR